MADMCGPFVCDYPDPRGMQKGIIWKCPRCGTAYKLSRSIKERWWRNWSAIDGYWRLTWNSRRKL